MDQQGFLEILARGFQKPDQANFQVFLIFLAMGALVFIVLGTSLIYQYRFTIRGRWLLLRKQWRGDQVSTDRRPKSLELVIQLPYRGDAFRTRIVNLSPNGMYVTMDPPLMTGESFRFLLNLDSKHKITGLAEFRWIQEKKTPYKPPGMGCKFYQVSDQDKLQIKKFLRV